MRIAEGAVLDPVHLEVPECLAAMDHARGI